LTPLIVTVIPERMDSPAKYRFMAALLKWSLGNTTMRLTVDEVGLFRGDILLYLLVLCEGNIPKPLLWASRNPHCIDSCRCFLRHTTCYSPSKASVRMHHSLRRQPRRIIIRRLYSTRSPAWRFWFTFSVENRI
jgi:hypothetical protein